MDQSEVTGRPVRVVRLRTVVIVAATVVAIVVAIGFVHVVYGGKVGIKLCAKDGWAIQDTLVNVDDYLDKPLISMIDKAKVLRAMFACEVLRRPGFLDDTDTRSRPRPRAMAAATKTKLDHYAVAYRYWLDAHPGKLCPEQLSQLNEYMVGGYQTFGSFIEMTNNDTNDAWGRPIKMFCGADNLPVGINGVNGFAMLSAGPDGKEGTDDDVDSWKPLE